MSSLEYQQILDNAYLSGANMTYLEGLYEDYLTDPVSVPAEWQAIFEKLPSPHDAFEGELLHRDVRAYFLKNAAQPARHVVLAEDKQSIVDAHVACMDWRVDGDDRLHKMHCTAFIRADVGGLVVAFAAALGRDDSLGAVTWPLYVKSMMQ